MSVFYPEGVYVGIVTAQAIVASKEKKTPTFVLKFKVVSTEDGEEVEKQYEREAYRYITEGTMPYLQEDLDALGFQGSSLRELDPENATHHSFVNEQVNFYCKHEEYKDKVYEKWSIARGLGGSKPIEGSPLDDKTYRKLDALFGKDKPKAVTPPKPRKVTQPAAPPPEPNGHGAAITDEDIPF